jgi:BNR repeat-like domain
MSMHIHAPAAYKPAPAALSRPRCPRAVRRAVILVAAALAAGFAAATPAHATQPGVTQISSDPYTPVNAPSGQHATEVEPDTFAFGSTVVSAFQTGRVFNGGATDIGWATSSNGGVSWTHGFLPGTSKEAMKPGPFFSVSDPSVAYDARDGAWIISWLGAHFSGGGIVDVMVSRSTDGGLTWSTPVTVAATGVFYDKNWTACDNSADSPFYGHCYTEFDNASSGDLELMSTSADGGLSWATPTPTADNVHGLGGQPVVQLNGRVVVPFEGFNGIRAFTSDNGGATWNASVLISTRSAHRVPGVRTSALPSAETNRDGTVYVVWQDNRFEPGGNANDIVLSTSADGTTWSPVSRIPLDPVGSNVDHFIPGIAVNPTSAGAQTQLALTYYFDTNPNCTGTACQIQVGFSSSLDNGQTWSNPQALTDPMQLGWLAPTTQGFMVGDYISTSFLAGQQRVVGALAIGFAPSSDGLLNEPMYAGLEKVRAGVNHTRNNPVLFNGAAATPSTTF